MRSRINHANLSLLFVALIIPLFATGCMELATRAIATATPSAETSAAVTPTDQAEPMPTFTSTSTSTNIGTPTPEPEAIAISTPATPAASLQIVSHFGSNNTYLVDGDDLSEYELGDDLVVYGPVTGDILVPVGLLKVVAKVENALSAQALLVHPDTTILSRFRVDANTENLQTSELVPASDVAVGYLLQEGRIRLRPGADLAAGDTLIALEPIIDGETILDYVPYTPAVQMQVSAIGIRQGIAVVELVTGEWPPVGSLVLKTEAESVVPEEPQYPCEGMLVHPRGLSTVSLTFRDVPGGGDRGTRVFTPNYEILVKNHDEGGNWSLVAERNGRELGWIPSEYVSLTSECPAGPA